MDRRTFVSGAAAGLGAAVLLGDPLAASAAKRRRTRYARVPLAKGVEATDRGNWQLAHLRCNRAKSDMVAGVYVRAATCELAAHTSRDWLEEKLEPLQ